MIAARESFGRRMLRWAYRKLVFIDESGVNLSQTRAEARAPRGERVIDHVPGRRWETYPIISGLRITGVFAPMLIPGAMNTDSLRAWVKIALAPELRPGDIVVWDNLGIHNDPEVAASSKEKGARVMFLPPVVAVTRRRAFDGAVSTVHCARMRLCQRAGDRILLSSTMRTSPFSLRAAMWIFLAVLHLPLCGCKSRETKEQERACNEAIRDGRLDIKNANLEEARGEVAFAETTCPPLRTQYVDELRAELRDSHLSSASPRSTRAI